MIKSQEVFPNINLLFQQVNSIYQHPLHYTYVLHKTDGLLHLYDEGIMEVVGKTKVMVLEQMRLFAFTNDFNLFYGIRDARFLIFQLTSSGWLAHILVAQHEPKPYLQAYSVSYYAKKNVILCITSSNFYFVQPNKGGYKSLTSPLKYHDSSFYPQKVAELSPLTWLVGYKNSIYFLKIDQSLDSYQVYHKIDVGNIVKLCAQNNPKKQFAYVINQQNQVLLIKIFQKYRQIKVCYKFFDKSHIPLYLTLLRPGINTSTTDKLKNRIYLSVYCRQKRQQKKQMYQNEVLLAQNQSINRQRMVDQNQQKGKQGMEGKMEKVQSDGKYHMFIIPTEAEYVSESTGLKNSQAFSLEQNKETFIIKNMPQLKISPWINVLMQNCLLFLTTKNQVCYINYCDIKQLGMFAAQWVCMGYKFQVLQKNQLYQERQFQFQDQAQREQKPITKDFLDDWSQSLLPKHAVLNKAFNRIRGLEI